MPSPTSLEPVDYLVVGHLACDLTPQGPRLGGTAAYAALTAQALGLRVGIVTAWGGETLLDRLDGIQVWKVDAEHSTTFENVYLPTGRVQFVHHVAPDLTMEHIPLPWRSAPIVHIGPIAGEGKTLVEEEWPAHFLGLTPQGWLRTWDGDGRVRPSLGPDAPPKLTGADAVVLSVEDVGGDETQIEALALACRVLVVTEGATGSRLYWNGDLRRFRAPPMTEVDATGAGDIFAAAFFWRYHSTRDPWAAARFATRLAACSVARPGLEGIPYREEIQTSLVEVL